MLVTVLTEFYSLGHHFLAVCAVVHFTNEFCGFIEFYEFSSFFLKNLTVCLQVPSLETMDLTSRTYFTYSGGNCRRV
jgi:hypothetical protein